MIERFLLSNHSFINLNPLLLMKRLILSIIALAVSALPLAAKTGSLEPKQSNALGEVNGYKGFTSEIIELKEGEVFTPLVSIGESSFNGRYLRTYCEFFVIDADKSVTGFGNKPEGLIYTNINTGEVAQSFYGPVKIFLRYSYAENGNNAAETNRLINEAWGSRDYIGFMQYRISSVVSSASSQVSLVGSLEPKQSNALGEVGIYTNFTSEIIELKEGEIFTPVLSIGESSFNGRYLRTNCEFFVIDADQSVTGFDSKPEGLIYTNINTGEVAQSFYGPVKIFLRYRYLKNGNNAVETERLINEAWSSRDTIGFMQYRIESVETPSVSEVLLQDDEFLNALASNTSFRQAFAASLAEDPTATASFREVLRIAEAELGISTNSSNITKNATGITANGTAIAGNGTSIQDIATSVTTIAASVQDNATGIATNGTAIAGNGTSIQDIATSVTTIATSVQDNATGIATNGTAIAGNGTSIQEIATGVAAIGTSVQDNANGIATNATAITSNASSVATNVTTIAGNATSAETNSGAITQINLTLQANQNERGRNVLEIAKNQLRIEALNNQIDSLGSDAAFIQKLGDEFVTKADLTTAISEGKTQGINAVTSDPNNWNIFTADQIQEMAVGDLVLTRQENGDFVLNYEIQQSDNAKDWTTYSAQAETITGLPVNKAFVRIRTR